LAALGQLTHQPRQDELGGILTDTAGKLGTLAKEVQVAIPGHTRQEIVAYPIRYEPHAGAGRFEPLEAVLLDCSGEAAKQLIADQKRLEEGEEGPLAQEVAEADTLLLVVDASVGPEVLERNFAAFGQFLAALQLLRGERTEVAGLPVFLVLNRCDLLAQT